MHYQIVNLHVIRSQAAQTVVSALVTNGSQITRYQWYTTHTLAALG